MEDPPPTQFSRNSLYRSTRRGVADTMEVAGVREIPEKYFVTVSGFPDSHDSFSTSSRELAGNKPRNITEV